MLSDSENSAAISAYSVGDEIDSLCHAYFVQQGQSNPPAIEKFITAIAPEHRGQLLAELIPVDMERRWTLGESPSVDDYRQRFPEFAEQIKQLKVRSDRTKTIQLDSSLPTKRSLHAVGQRLLHFVLLKRVGRGSFGEVWQAKDTELNRTVAVKIPHASVIDQVGVEAARHEGQAAAQLKHTNIVTVHAIETGSDVLLIVSEFINGPSLKKWLESNRPSFEETAQLCAKLAEGLYHAHDRGVFHRDMKPSNVLMDEADEPHIADFGLAKNLAADQSIASDGQIMGTPAYMSPEQADGKSAQVDGRSDLFSLGVMLYEMLTGKLPFQGNKLALLRSIKQDEPARPRALRTEIPRDLETICLKALEKDPARRYASAQEMAVDLRRYLRGDAIVARRATLPERGWRYLKRHPARAIAAALSLVAMLAAGAAVNLAQANREMLGLRPVSITTSPSGARLAVAPLNPVTGEPDEGRVIFAPTRSPAQLELAPGEYFVVALLDDGRFHEVYRMVPEQYDRLPGSTRSHRWQLADDGTVDLCAIEIPPLTVTRDMAPFEAVADVKMRLGSTEQSPLADVSVDNFFMDRREFTGKQYVDMLPTEAGHIQHACRTEDHAMHVYGEHAMSIAEAAGKRLPWDSEWLRAATAGDFDKFARDAGQYEEEINDEFAPAGFPEFDRVPDSGGGFVWGLRSNVAEWTATHANIQMHNDKPAPLPIFNSSVSRWVRGGDIQVIEGSPTVDPVHRNPQGRVAVDRFRHLPGIGFRGVRSAEPHLFSTSP